MKIEQTGFGHPLCYAAELQDCCTEISREHYMTEAVMHAIAGSGRTIEVRGLPWLSEPKEIATKSLTGWVLCTRHNSAVSDLDTEALNLVQNIDRIAEGFNNGVDEEFTVDGDRFERWMLKTLCGFLSTNNMVNHRGEGLLGWKPPRRWLEIIFQDHKFPDACGLHLSRSNGGVIEEISPELLRVAPLYYWEQKSVIGMRMWLFNVEFILAMDEAVGRTVERLLDDAIYRPHCLLYKDPGCVKLLTFKWDNPAQGQPFEIRRLPLFR